MKVILLERVEKLGQMGQLVDVKPGFARNFLLPRSKALRATKENIAAFETRRIQLEADDLKRREDAKYVADKMDGTKILLIRQASEVGQLYGSIRSRDIAEALTQDGFSVNKSHIHILKPIKTLGLHQVRVALHPEVSVNISVNVALSVEEATAQEKSSETESE